MSGVICREGSLWLVNCKHASTLRLFYKDHHIVVRMLSLKTGTQNQRNGLRSCKILTAKPNKHTPFQEYCRVLGLVTVTLLHH